jgi:hypothetical protein
MLAVAAACRIQLTPGGRGNQLYHEIIRFYDGDPERLLDGPCGGEPDYWVYRWIRVVALVLLGRELGVRARISAWSNLLRGGRSDVQLVDAGAAQNVRHCAVVKASTGLSAPSGCPGHQPSRQLGDDLHAFLAD